jgi:ABC-type lipoprotein release transport system permease subunit
MNLSFNIAKRYFFSRKSGGSFNLITIISGISLLGYMVGAAALLIVLSVFNGFEGLFISMYNKFDADIKVTATKGKVFDVSTANIPSIQKIEGVWKISEVLEENVLLKYGERQNLATVKGVDENYTYVTDLDSSIVAGISLLQIGDTNFAIVGQGIAYQLSIDPNDVFYRLNIFIPKRGVTDVLNPENSFSKAAISPVGIFSVQEEVDNKYVIVPLRFLRNLLDRKAEVSSLDIRLNKDANLEDVKEKISAQLGENFIVQNRFEQRDAFFKVMQSEKAVSYMILLFILFVAASNTIGSLYILVMEKKRDLHILSSLGLSKQQAALIFKYEGLMIALVGGIIGLLLGAVLCLAQEKFGFVKIEGAESFTMDHYPIKLKMMDILLVFITVVFLGWLTSLYPAKKAKELFLN